MGKGTDLQKIIDAVKIKIPDENLSGKENQLMQLLKSATAQCRRKTYDDIRFFYDEKMKDGYFYNHVSQPAIELLSMYIVRDYLTWEFSVLGKRKQYLGTSAFNKIPSSKEQYDFLSNRLDYWNQEIEKFETHFPDYSDDR